MKDKPGYQDFYGARGRQAMWLTGSVSYRLGALLAVPASRLGVSPNVVSLASLIVAVVGTALAILMGYGNWWAAAVLFISGQLAYGLDCADGVLARVTGRGSTFGAILDKAIDTFVGISIPVILALGALSDPLFLELGLGWKFAALALFTASRMSLVVSMWLREAMEKRERTAEDTRQRTPAFYIKQAVGNVVLDDVSFRTMLALAWGLGLFWELLFILAALLPLMFLTYLMSAKRAMDAEDREARKTSS